MSQYNINKQLDGKSVPVTIMVDHRENAEVLLKDLKEHHYLVVEKTHLEIGDYKIFPDIILERKTVDDFCLSIVDGRLFRQAFRLVQLTENPILIIEGSTFANRNHKVSIESIKGALVTLAQTYRLPVIRSSNQKDSAWYINLLCRQRKRIGQNSGVLSSYRPKRLNKQKEYLLRSLPGVGPKLAKSILRQFETIENVAHATQKDLAEIDGLGEKKSEKIYQVLHESQSEYPEINRGE